MNRKRFQKKFRAVIVRSYLDRGAKPPRDDYRRARIVAPGSSYNNLWSAIKKAFPEQF